MPRRPEPVRLTIDDDRRTLTIPAHAGEAVRLGFRHSVYGSAVEEEFVVTPEGLRLVRLRYGELRLAEFYGHEHARREGDAWIVDGLDTLHPSIVVRVSPDSAMRLTTAGAAVDLVEWAGGHQPARVTIAAAPA